MTNQEITDRIVLLQGRANVLIRAKAGASKAQRKDFTNSISVIQAEILKLKETMSDN